MFSWFREIITAGFFYAPFLLFIGFSIFVLVIGISTFLAGTFLFILFAGYGIYASLRDTGSLVYLIEKSKILESYLDIDIVENINKSFVLHNSEHIPKKQALYICHPHGVLGVSWLYYLCGTWYNSTKKPYIALHSLLFRFPFLSEILKANHCIDSSESTIRSYLQKGESVAIITGGAEEMMYMKEDTINIVIKKRKGYSRLAKEAQVPVVILFNTNEHRIFPPNTSSIWKVFNECIFRFTRVLFPLPSWKAITNWVSILRKPLDEPITTFVLKPVETQGKSVETIQQECILRIEEFMKEKKLKASIVA